MERTLFPSFEGEGERMKWNPDISMLRARVRSRMVSRSGQGTTEYAIIVGVIVVIAILAVTSFRGKIAELWSDISTAILGL